MSYLVIFFSERGIEAFRGELIAAMKTPILFYTGIALLVSYTSLALDAAPENEIHELFKRQATATFVPKLLAHITKEKRRLEASIKNPSRISEQHLRGDDWISFRNYDVELTASSPFIVPYEKWELNNCCVQVRGLSRQRLSLTVIPYCFPVLGEAELPDATWKAVLWLEPQKGHLQADEIEKNKITIEQLEVCQKNLIRQYEALLESSALEESGGLPCSAAFLDFEPEDF